ncbi:uncharacterized protein [Diadema setosum]|uniref:uncharacterized protein n=1 Tax=Diadema setosum TaxID=31175 RepID=UPI003B3A9DF4
METLGVSHDTSDTAYSEDTSATVTSDAMNTFGVTSHLAGADSETSTEVDTGRDSAVQPYRHDPHTLGNYQPVSGDDSSGNDHSSVTMERQDPPHEPEAPSREGYAHGDDNQSTTGGVIPSIISTEENNPGEGSRSTPSVEETRGSVAEPPPSGTGGVTPLLPPQTVRRGSTDHAAASGDDILHIHEDTFAESTSNVPQRGSQNPLLLSPEKSLFEAYLLCVPFGIFGAHHFYLGNRSFGFLYLFTFGLFTIGWIVDLLTLKFTVKEVNRQLKEADENGLKTDDFGSFSRLYETTLLQAYLFALPPLGILGCHNFAMDRIRFGVLYFFTVGLYFFGWIADLIRMPFIVRRRNREVRLYRQGLPPPPAWEKLYLDEAYVLALPLGVVGLHHFYLRRYFFGVVYAMTLGLFGILTFIDLFRMSRLLERRKTELKENTRQIYLDDAYMLAVPFGFLGFHHFYMKRYAWGFFYLFTLGLCGVGWIGDLYRLPSLVERENVLIKFHDLTRMSGDEQARAPNRYNIIGTRMRRREPTSISQESVQENDRNVVENPITIDLSTRLTQGVSPQIIIEQNIPPSPGNAPVELGPLSTETSREQSSGNRNTLSPDVREISEFQFETNVVAPSLSEHASGPPLPPTEEPREQHVDQIMLVAIPLDEHGQPLWAQGHQTTAEEIAQFRQRSTPSPRPGDRPMSQLYDEPPPPYSPPTQSLDYRPFTAPVDTQTERFAHQSSLISPQPRTARVDIRSRNQSIGESSGMMHDAITDENHEDRGTDFGDNNHEDNSSIQTEEAQYRFIAQVEKFRNLSVSRPQTSAPMQETSNCVTQTRSTEEENDSVDTYPKSKEERGDWLDDDDDLVIGRARDIEGNNTTIPDSSSHTEVDDGEGTKNVLDKETLKDMRSDWLDDNHELVVGRAGDLITCSDNDESSGHKSSREGGAMPDKEGALLESTGVTTRGLDYFRGTSNIDAVVTTLVSKEGTGDDGFIEINENENVESKESHTDTYEPMVRRDPNDTNTLEKGSHYSEADAIKTNSESDIGRLQTDSPSNRTNVSITVHNDEGSETGVSSSRPDIHEMTEL